MKPREAVQDVEELLSAAGVPGAGTDAEILVAHVTGIPRSTLALQERSLEPAEVERLHALAGRRRAREPLQHILGEWGFRRLTLAVDRRALVPRPETEMVVERALALIAGLEAPRVLDVGTGSGAIALALLDEHPGARVTGLDASGPALELAGENAGRLGVSDRIELVQAHVGAETVASSGLVHATKDSVPFDLVVSNPPYVREEDLPRLEPEVRDHDPREAILESGLTDAVARAARDVLRPGGWLVLECGDGRASGVAELLASLGYRQLAVTQDLAGFDRVVEARR